MNRRFTTRAHPSRTLLAAFALLALAGLAAPDASAQDRNRRAGRFEVSTAPGSYPIFIDGQDRGMTGPTVQLYDVEPGVHTVEIRFPNNTTWRREFVIAPN